ncbi:MAG: anti-sigma factor antagonist [Calditrichaeota bacterium]|nr:MAG: anti-sigma factor antagonist [Calditrichota bacterium]
MGQKGNILSIAVKKEASIVSLHEKRIYMQFTDQFRYEMDILIESHHRDLIIDFSGVNMINSLGIGVLISTANAINKYNKKLVIVGLNPSIEEIFTRMRLNMIFDIGRNVREGLALL